MIGHYSRLLEKHGPFIEALGDKYPDPQIPLEHSASEILESSVKRYANLTNIEPIARGSSVLDVGCGLGYLCDYMREAGWHGAYTGVDINPDMIAAAKERLPGEEFICADILTDGFHQQADYVFCGGTVQIRPRFTDPKAYLHEMIRKMFSLAEKGLAFDVFSTRVDYMDDEDKLYTDPVDLLRFCYGLTPRIMLRNDCRPYEFLCLPLCGGI